MFLPILSLRCDVDNDNLEVPEECNLKYSSDGWKKRKQWKVYSVLGKGAFGLVKLVQKKLNPEGTELSKKLYAMKIIDKWSIIESKHYDPFAESYAKNELRIGIIVKQLRTPFLSQLQHAFQTSDKLYFIFDYLGGGELFNHVQDFENGMPIETARLYLSEILVGLTSLHKAGILHRDLRLENILLDKRGHAHICDFGLAILLNHEEDSKIPWGLPMEKRRTDNVFVGANSIFMAPEYFNSEDGYGIPLDFWQFGIMAFAMLTKKYPPHFKKPNREEIMRSQLENFDADIQNFIISLLQINENDRLGSREGCPEIQRNAFFESIDWDVIKEKMASKHLIEVQTIDIKKEARDFDSQLMPQGALDVLPVSKFDFNTSRSQFRATTLDVKGESDDETVMRRSKRGDTIATNRGSHRKMSQSKSLDLDMHDPVDENHTDLADSGVNKEFLDTNFNQNNMRLSICSRATDLPMDPDFLVQYYGSRETEERAPGGPQPTTSFVINEHEPVNVTSNIDRRSMRACTAIEESKSVKVKNSVTFRSNNRNASVPVRDDETPNNKKRKDSIRRYSAASHLARKKRKGEDTAIMLSAPAAPLPVTKSKTEPAKKCKFGPSLTLPTISTDELEERKISIQSLKSPCSRDTEDVLGALPTFKNTTIDKSLNSINDNKSILINNSPSNKSIDRSISFIPGSGSTLNNESLLPPSSVSFIPGSPSLNPGESLFPVSSSSFVPGSLTNKFAGRRASDFGAQFERLRDTKRFNTTATTRSTLSVRNQIMHPPCDEDEEDEDEEMDSEEDEEARRSFYHQLDDMAISSSSETEETTHRRDSINSMFTETDPSYQKAVLMDTTT